MAARFSFAVSEAVLEVVAVGLEDIERLVLDLPSRPAAGGKFDDRIGTNRQIGDEAVAIRRIALGIDDLDLEPVDLERILAVTQRHVMQPAVAMDEALLAAPDRLLHRRQVDPGNSIPVRYSRINGCDDGLQTKMKCPPASKTAWQSGWRENRSSPR